MSRLLPYKKIPDLTAQDLARFWRRVSKTPGGCWNWTAAVRGKPPHAYGCFFLSHPRSNFVASRISYYIAHGEMPRNLTIDHLCRNTLCVRPNHLSAVSMKVNLLRGINPAAINRRKHECLRGHALSGNNLFLNTKGKRICRKCQRIRQKKYRLTMTETARIRTAQRVRQWRANHREQYNAAVRRWREKNRERINEHSLRRYYKNRDMINLKRRLKAKFIKFEKQAIAISGITLTSPSPDVR